MEARDFCYWLQGGFELNPGLTLDGDKIEMIKKHLDMTLAHVAGSPAKTGLPKLGGKSDGMNVRC